ncbi:unnamed protein product [Toxocara canis]|uniref:Alpha-carbonic anhydrase domain-containing protein n=1 Tax=Toxocara canis TaxID=6265 RepID=A0A183V4W9_TOXCA|nr:unnamed protein product [Toxocara canis]
MIAEREQSFDGSHSRTASIENIAWREWLEPSNYCAESTDKDGEQFMVFRGFAPSPNHPILAQSKEIF